MNVIKNEICIGIEKPFTFLQITANPTTRAAYEFIMSCPNLKAIVSGHMHFSFETKPETSPRQIITGLHTLREITVR